MRFINVLSYSCAKYLSTQLKESHQKKSVYYYGFQAIIGSIVDAVVVILIALIMRTLVPTLIILIIFASLRVFAGGFHMDTFGKCFATTTILFTGAGIFSQYSYKYWDIQQLITLLILTSLTSIFVIVKWAPKDTPNKPITKYEDRKKFKNLSLNYIVLWTLVAGILLYYGFSRNITYTNLIVISSSMGILLEMFMVTPIGYGFLKKISGQKRQLNISLNPFKDY